MGGVRQGGDAAVGRKFQGDNSRLHGPPHCCLFPSSQAAALARASSLGRVTSTVAAPQATGRAPSASWAPVGGGRQQPSASCWGPAAVGGASQEESMAATECGDGGGGGSGLFRGLYFTVAAVESERSICNAASQLIWWGGGVGGGAREWAPEGLGSTGGARGRI